MADKDQDQARGGDQRKDQPRREPPPSTGGKTSPEVQRVYEDAARQPQSPGQPAGGE